MCVMSTFTCRNASDIHDYCCKKNIFNMPEIPKRPFIEEKVPEAVPKRVAPPGRGIA